MTDATLAEYEQTESTIEKRGLPVICPIVGVGASAGGLEALTAMFDDVEADIGMSFVVVLHLDPHHESMMAELIDRKTKLSVRQVRDGDTVRPNYVHIIPPGHGLRIERNKLRLSEFSEPRGVRRPIDDFFVSLAEDQGRNAAGVILSGTGSDGSIGLRSIKESGGLCIAQSPGTARYDGMPTSAAGTGLVDELLPPQEIVAKIRRFFDNQQSPAIEPDAAMAAGYVEDICAYVNEMLGHDFSGYKRTTLQRRIERRMQITGALEGATYLDRIRNDSNECEALFRDLLINVTNFFRDPELFDVVRKRAIDVLVGGSSGSDPIRVWVPGCSSGEEAFTLAILFADAAAQLGHQQPVQIFATDIDNQMLAVAREGRYPISAMADIPERYRDKYLSFTDNHIKLSAAIRDMVRFSPHSIIRDPAFSRLDLISCRNLLIYFGAEIQSAIVPLMHYALKPGGFLFLGPSEGVNRREDLFSTIDQKARLYRRRDTPVSYPIELPSRPSHRPERPKAPSNRWENGAGVSLVNPNPGSLRLLEHYVPPSVIVDSDGVIVDSRGRLAKYLEMRPGLSANDILTLGENWPTRSARAITARIVQARIACRQARREGHLGIRDPGHYRCCGSFVRWHNARRFCR